MKHVLKWEKELITEIENVIYEWVQDLDVVGTDFHPAFRELLGLDNNFWGLDDDEIPPRPPTPAPQ
jgi:hypothetical protein